MRKNLWKWVFVGLLVAWSLYEIYPPAGRDLTQVFRERAVNKSDLAFSNIWVHVMQLQKQRPDRPFGNLQEAIGTNDITRYFPFFNAKDQTRPTTAILNRLQREAAGKIKLGLDLQGGTSFMMEMDTSKLITTETVTNQAGQVTTRTNILADAELRGVIEHAVEVLRNRVDKFGVAEPTFQPVGSDGILVQLPGLSADEREIAQRTLQKPAFLEFRLVHERSEDMIKAGEMEPGYEIMREVRRGSDGTKPVHDYLVKKKPERGMTGAYIKRAGVFRGNMGDPRISFTLTDDGAALFGDITRENVGRLLAIVLDGELYSAPQIKGPIETGSGEISGSFDIREAYELANVLENPLKAPLKLAYSRDVDPTLGADSIRSGIKAAIIGTASVSAFMIVYYLFAGAVANVAMILNIFILLGVMCAVDTTLTMPGIAGVVLTIGMSVDANVLIFERIREETAKGKSLRGALVAGYDRAFGTIFDSHVTTLISSIILIFMGTGAVKGFGVALTIGVAASLFTALVVTRIIFDLLLEKGWLKAIRMYQFPFLHGTQLDFMRWAKVAFAISWLLIVIGNCYGIFVRGQDVLGVEFTGGESVTLAFDQKHKIDVDKLREVASKASGSEVLVGYQHDVGAGTDTLRITARAVAGKDGAKLEDAGAKVVSALRQQFPDAKYDVRGMDRVGPTVGSEIEKVAVLASLLAMFGILVYVAFRYEFSFAIGAVIAIVHDILMTTGWYFLAGRQMNATTVAALLTIIGFSINDTIVIFDRIRENLKLGLRGTFTEIMNKALNQTLSRTLITSGTVFLSTLSLYLFGGGVINDFAFAFLVGILTGTYSSIYIASALVLWWHKGQRPDIGQPLAGQPSSGVAAKA
jgi:SecD/SecF fusion protein